MEKTVAKIPSLDIRSIGIQIVREMASADVKSLLPVPHSDATVLDIAGYAVIEKLCNLLKSSCRSDLWDLAIEYVDTLAFPHVENPIDDNLPIEVVDEDVEMYSMMIHPAIDKIIANGDAEGGIDIEVVVGGLIYGAVGCLVASHSLKTAREIVSARLSSCLRQVS